MYYLKNVRYKVPHTDEEIYFDDGDVAGFYDIINWQFNSNGELSYINVGHYNGSAAPEDRMIIMNDSIVWNNDQLMVSNINHTLLYIMNLCLYASMFTFSTCLYMYGTCMDVFINLCTCVCCSLLGQCAVRTASRAPGKASVRESQSAALTVFHVPTERSATQPVSIQLSNCSLHT